jgi:long-chain acyl-CoA synthetase
MHVSLNLATSLRESARAHADRVALAAGERTVTYGALHAAVQRFAGALRSLGVERGQHVALLLPNVPEFTISYFGAAYAGCPIVPLNTLLTAEEIAYHLHDGDSVALVTVPALLPQAQAAVARPHACRHVLVAGADHALAGAVSFERMLAEAEPFAQTVVTGADDATAAALKDGWFSTGDIGHRDEDGFYFVVDRKTRTRATART